MSRTCVAHVITQLELGGAQQNTLYTVSHLDRGQFAPALLAGPGGALDAEARALSDVPFFALPDLQRAIAPARDLYALGQLRRLLRLLPRPLIVHTHSSKAGALGRLAARSIGADAVVHSVHGFAFHDRQRAPTRASYIAIERSLASLADAYVCVSLADRERGQRLGLFGSAHVELIRSGIVFDEFRFSEAARQRIRRQLAIPPAAPTVGTIANFKPQKAPLDFVATAVAVLDKWPDVHFVYVGDGALRPAVEAAVASARVGHRVHLVGWQTDIGAYLSSFDLFLLTSHHEGLPRSVLQARVNGCPVVATRTGGTDEVVPAADLAAPGDVAALAHLVEQRLVGLGPRVPSALPDDLLPFSAERMVRDQERLYRRLLGQKQ
ncbi:MAG: glycosyltransferase [Deltaproteobacteria bacterium]|nr:glycosyltransferase [Deltaproteobacteria bacterium]